MSFVQTVILCPILLLAACGEAEVTVPDVPPEPVVARVDPVIPTFAEGELVFEYSSHSHFGGSSGYRIFADGRYEAIGEQSPDEVHDAHEPRWESMRTLSEDELGAFYAVMYGYDLASLEAEYAPEQRVMDGASGHWTLRLEAGPKQVVVRQGVEVPALEAIWAALPEAVVLDE